MLKVRNETNHLNLTERCDIFSKMSGGEGTRTGSVPLEVS